MNQPRYDVYRNIHKLIRKELFDVSTLLGRADHATPQGGAARNGLRAAFEHLESHASQEETHVHPLVEARDPALARSLDADHATLDEAARAMARTLREIESAPLDGRRSLGDELYATFNLYVADQLRHMQREEREVNAVLWRNFGDEQLAALTGRIVASLPPQVAAGHFAAMLEVVHPEDRALMLANRPAA